MLDFENGGVSKHLGKIQLECHVRPSTQLLKMVGSLTPADVAAIKVKHSGELRLQT